LLKKIGGGGFTVSALAGEVKNVVKNYHRRKVYRFAGKPELQ